MGRHRTLTEEMVFMRTKCNRLDLIKNLNLWGNDLHDISVLQLMPNLEVLSLSVNRVNSLADICHCSKLSELYLRKNDIRDLTDVRHLKKLRCLKVLWLSDNPCATLPHYRMYVLQQLPGLAKLDAQDVTGEEKRQAADADLRNLKTRAEVVDGDESPDPDAPEQSPEPWGGQASSLPRDQESHGRPSVDSWSGGAQGMHVQARELPGEAPPERRPQGNLNSQVRETRHSRDEARDAREARESRDVREDMPAERRRWNSDQSPGAADTQSVQELPRRDIARNSNAGPVSSRQPRPSQVQVQAQLQSSAQVGHGHYADRASSHSRHGHYSEKSTSAPMMEDAEWAAYSPMIDQFHVQDGQRDDFHMDDQWDDGDDYRPRAAWAPPPQDIHRARAAPRSNSGSVGSNGKAEDGVSMQRFAENHSRGDPRARPPMNSGAEPAGRADNILCAVLALIKELDQQGLELVRRAIEQRQREL